MRFGGGPPARSGWSVPNQFWATSAATRSIPLGVEAPHTGPSARLADGYAERTGRWWTRFDPQNVDPVTGRSLRERWEIWDRRSQPGAQSAGQRRIAFPAARNWLICALYAARVRWSAARSLPA